MKQLYDDILALTDKKPIWWDERGLPRWKPFSPDCTTAITTEVVLMEIVCTGCWRHFMVEIRSGSLDRESLSSQLADCKHSVSYGDPPRHNDGKNRCYGEVMQSDPIKILEFWKRASAGFLWERIPGLEIRLDE